MSIARIAISLLRLASACSHSAQGKNQLAAKKMSVKPEKTLPTMK